MNSSAKKDETIYPQVRPDLNAQCQLEVPTFTGCESEVVDLARFAHSANNVAPELGAAFL